MKLNNRIGTLSGFKALSIVASASALATLAQPILADSSVMNQTGVYEQTVARATWPHHVRVKFAAPSANGEHPAVIVAREFDLADHQSQLFLHPAGLALLAEPPQAASGQPQSASLKPE